MTTEDLGREIGIAFGKKSDEYQTYNRMKMEMAKKESNLSRLGQACDKALEQIEQLIEQQEDEIKVCLEEIQG